MGSGWSKAGYAQGYVRSVHVKSAAVGSAGPCVLGNGEVGREGVKPCVEDWGTEVGSCVVAGDFLVFGSWQGAPRSLGRASWQGAPRSLKYTRVAKVPHYAGRGKKEFDLVSHITYFYGRLRFPSLLLILFLFLFFS